VKKTNNPQSKSKLSITLADFFNKIKGRQPVGRKDSYQTVIQTSRRLDSFMYEADQIFELFSNIQDQN
jgi:hypothetical protein